MAKLTQSPFCIPNTTALSNVRNGRFFALALAAIIAAVLMFAAFTPSAAFAVTEEEESDSIAASTPQVTDSFDRDGYVAGDRATITFRAVNNTAVAWQGVSLAAQLPASVKLAGDSSSSTVDRDVVEPGEAVDLVFEALFTDAVAGAASGDKLARTGDSVMPILAFVAIAAAFAVLATLSFSRHRKLSQRSRNGISVLVAVSLVVGLAPAIPSYAHANEAAGSDASTGASVFTVSGSAVCSSPSISIPATLTITSVDIGEPGPMAQVSVVDSQAVSANARYAQIDLVSDAPFAEDLSAETVTLGESFEGLTLTSLQRTGDMSATVRVEGNPGAPGANGLLIFGQGSFQDASATACAAVSAESPFFSFDAGAMTYDQDRSFSIPLSVTNGWFASDAAALHFTFNDVRLTATSFTIDAADNRRGTLDVSVDMPDPAEQLEVLAAALDAVAPAAISFDPKVLVGEPAIDLTHDKIEGIPTITADAVDAIPYGSIEATDLQRQSDDSLRISVRVDLSADDGSIALSNKNQIELPATLSSNAVVDEVGDNWFTYSFDVDADASASWLGAYEEFSDSSELATTEFLDDVTSLLAAQTFEMADGVVFNDLGISQGACTVSLTSEPADNAEVLGSSSEDAKTAFEVLSALANAIGSFCQKDKGSIGNGIGSLLGLVATLIDTTPSITIKDVYDELQQMKGQLSRMETGIDQLAVQLNNVQKRAGFTSNWYEVKRHMDHLNSYGSMYVSLMGKIDATDTGASFDEYSASNQKTLKSFANAIEKKNRLLNTTVVADTMELGNLIMGFDKGTVEEYFDWIETYYNWDPETFDAKYLYLDSLITAYVYGYGTSMAYMNTMDATDDDDFFGPDDSVYAESIEDLRKQADLVIKKLAGSVKTDENGEPYLAEKSFLRMASEPRTDGQVRCLINDKVYAKSMLNNTTHPRYLGMFPRSVERDDVHLYKFSSSINLAQWKQMWENLPQVRNVKNFEQAASVWKELLAMGFDQGGPERSDLSIGNYKNHGDSLTKWYGSHYHSSIVAVGDASYTKTVDQTAVKHYRETRLDTYNLANGTIKYDTAISYHYETYLVSPVWWGYEHRLYPVTSVL